MLAKSQKKEQYTGLSVPTQTATATQSEEISMLSDKVCLMHSCWAKLTIKMT